MRAAFFVQRISDSKPFWRNPDPKRIIGAMAILHCPRCGVELKELGTRYSCADCGVVFAVKFTCADCGGEPEQITGCGSVSYFCKSCNALKSRTTMQKEFSTVEHAG